MPYRPEDLDQMRLRQSEAAAERKVREGQYTPSDPLYKFKNTGGEIGAPTAMDDVRGFVYDMEDTPTEGAQISPLMAGEAALAALTSGGSMGISNALRMTGRGRGAGSMQRAARDADFLNETDRMAAEALAKFKGGIGKTGPKVEKPRYEADDIFDMSPEEIAKQKQTGEVQMSRVPSPEKQAKLNRKAQSKKTAQAKKPEGNLGPQADRADDFYTARRKAGQEGEILTTDSRIPDPVSDSVQRNDTFRTEAGGYSPRGGGEGASTNPQRVTYKPDSGGTKGMNPGRRRQMQLEREGRPSGRANVSSDMERQGVTDPVQGETQRRLRQTPVGKKSSKRRDAADRRARDEGPDSKRRVSASSKKRKKDKDEEINYSYGDE